HDGLFAADHQAVTAARPAHLAAEADVDVVDAQVRELRRPAAVFGVLGRSADDDDVFGLDAGPELGDRRVDVGRRTREPDDARRVELVDQIGDGRGAVRALGGDLGDRSRGRVVHDTGPARRQQATGDGGAGPAEIDHSHVHDVRLLHVRPGPVRSLRRRTSARRSATFRDRRYFDFPTFVSRT